MLDKLQKELATEGTSVNIVAVNAAAAASLAAKLTQVADFPVFQDTSAVDAWGQQGGGKDDMFIYDGAGRLYAHLPIGGEIDTNLSDATGYQNVKSALLAAAAIQP